MLGHALFAAVWLIVAAGLLMPAYTPDSRGAGPVPSVATFQVAVAAVDCPDCTPVGAGEEVCQPNCACSHLLTTAAETADQPGGQIIYLVVQPLPADRPSRPRPFPPKLPAI